MKVKDQFEDLPDAPQRATITGGLDRNILVEASAGTGKTACLVERMVSLVRKGMCSDVSQMVGITFTRKAAEELKIRFQVGLVKAHSEALEYREKERLRRALESFERCFVGTIHSFCAHLLRERPVEAGVDPDFAEMDELTESVLRRWAWRKFARQAQEKANTWGDLAPHLDALAAHGISLDQLENAFKTMADFSEIERWPCGTEEMLFPESCGDHFEVIMSFLEKLSRIQKRLPQDPKSDRFIPLLRKIHRAGRRLIETGGFTATRPDLVGFLELFESGDPERGRRVKSWTGEWGFTREEADEILDEFSKAKEAALAWLARARAASYRAAIPVLRKALGFLSQLKEERGLLGFQDLLLKTVEMLRGDPEVRRRFREKYRYILVDEFQDTDPLQAEILFLLTSRDPEEKDWRKCLPLPGSLFVVGDPKQSIYRFRRADIQIYQEVKEIFLKDPHGEVLTLWSNFRSLPCLVEEVNRCFSHWGRSDEPNFLPFGCGEDFNPSYHPMSSVREEPQAEGNLLRGVYFLRSSGVKEEAARWEAEYIARLIRRALDGEINLPSRLHSQGEGSRPRPEDFMVLTWKKEELTVYAEALGRWGIPHTLSGGGPLRENVALRILHLILKAVLLPEDPVPLVALLRGRLFGLSDRELYIFSQAGGHFDFRQDVPAEESFPDGELRAVFLHAFQRLRLYRRWVLSMSPVAALERIAEDAGIFALAAAADEEGLTSGGLFKALDLLRLASRLQAGPYECLELLEDLLEGEWEADSVAATEPAGRGVRVMNLHKAKGLEAPVVFLACPFGLSNRGPTLHVERHPEGDAGYLLMTASSPSGRSFRRSRVRTLAHPLSWGEKAEREELFVRAERTRLLYVAATRARDALIVSLKDDRNTYNPWWSLRSLQGKDLREAFPVSDDQSSLSREIIPIGPKTGGEVPDASLASIQERKAICVRPTYRLVQGREAAIWLGVASEREELEPEELSMEEGEEEETEAIARPDSVDATRWGEIVHLALKKLMEERTKGPREIAQELAVLNQWGEREEDRLKALLDKVSETPLWERAQRSQHVLCEVPFHYAEKSDGEEVVIHGAIDLIFEEDGGWVMADYKTERLPHGLPEVSGHLSRWQGLQKHAEQLMAYSGAWERITGLPVRERWLLFVSEAKAIMVP